MYEDQTFEKILSRVLSKAPESMDKREGSVLYDALAPAALELAQIYIELDNILNETFADTATRYFLIKRAKERGIVPQEASCAIAKGIFNVDVPVGSRFSLDNLNFVAIEKIEDGVFKLKCETPGRVANGYLGTLIPIDYIKNLSSAELSEILIPGEEEEDTEEFRKRYMESLNSKAFGGNVLDYKQKALSINGVGAVRVIPHFNGGGTVKLIIINSDYSIASDTLISTVQNYIDPKQDGLGMGMAPIGHIVTVGTAEEIKINISTAITFQEGYTFQMLKSQIESVLSAYISEFRKVWGEEDGLIIRISQIETRMLNLQGILDITGTKINGKASNFILQKDQIPKAGEAINEQRN